MSTEKDKHSPNKMAGAITLAVVVAGFVLRYQGATWGLSKTLPQPSGARSSGIAAGVKSQGYIEITKTPSPAIRLPIVDGYPTHEILAGVVGDNIAYAAEYNGGPAQGGWIDHVPPRSQAQRNQKVFFKGRVAWVRYWIESTNTINKAQLLVTIQPIAQQ